MANTPTPKIEIKYVQSATPTAQITQQETNDNGNLLQPQDQGTQKEIQATPTILVTPTPASNVASVPIQYNFLNPRVFGVVLGILFLWVYVKGLRKKR